MRDSLTDVNARLARSLRTRGLRDTLRAALRHVNVSINRFLDRHFDIAFGSDTRGVIESLALGDVESPNLARGIRYEPTRALPLRAVLRRSRIPTGGGFVDLGCGKGRALMLAALAGFSHVTGVDYSRTLCRIAEKNLDLLRERTKLQFTSSIVTADAADHTLAPHDTVIYLFNPFDAVVLAAVLARLRRSIDQHPRTVWIIYHNPVWRDAIEHAGMFVHVRDYGSGSGVFAVYRSR